MGCPNPFSQVYLVENQGMIVHDLKTGDVNYVDLDESQTNYFLFDSASYSPKTGGQYFCHIEFEPGKPWLITNYEYYPEVLSP